ncbi:PEP/pyruvate-binding domain-containing protein [Nocardiopsis sediminis]|uniref:PEP/pyruvate-binding domain-containing protein n=1 Tax=Nocardiopsis sediminis TaxID=1778267 RepID=A0ABV8FKN3_9ACTN
MNVIPLSEITDGMAELVGGKAAGLAAMIAAGERVPDGFCLTTAAHRAGVVPEEEVAAAYERLGRGPVAVRSSATTEDLPDASFAGQQDTILDVTGAAGVVAAVRRVWDSLHSERAAAYREANGIDPGTAAMAVVVQRMVDASTAGVMFTADPITGRRTTTVVDAVRGPGAAVADGTAVPDHYVLDAATGGGTSEERGCLSRRDLDALHRAGARLQALFGAPQDVEWAIDRDGEAWLLQSRPITTLFPLPPDRGGPEPRVYLEFGHVQGMLQPFTPMGLSAVQVVTAGIARSFGIPADPLEGPAGIVGIGGRLYGDLTGFVRSAWTRARLPEAMGVDFGPRAQAAVERVMEDPRFAVRPGRPVRARTAISVALRTVPRALVGIGRTLARPEAARDRVMRAIEEAKDRPAAEPRPLTAAQRLESVAATADGRSIPGDTVIWPVATALLVTALPAALLKGVADDAEMNTVLGGLSHNVTTEMDLALWRVAEGAAGHRALLSETPPERLAAMYAAGTLPDIGLRAFLDVYGHRAAGEVDVGVPRWAEDPAPLFAAIANYLRLTDPDQTPDRRFARAAAAAEATIDRVLARARRARPVRGRLAGFLMRRARTLAGLREAGKFAGLYRLREMRRQLLLAGGELADRGLLEEAGDIMFLSLAEAHAVVDGEADHRALVAARKALHRRELRRRHVPVALLSDGTDLEALTPPGPPEAGTLTGTAAAAGRATGPARVVHDPAGARVEPGEILVASTTDPGWTPLFLTVGGLVIETGSPMAHGPTVAREYGVPTVVGVRDATRRIRTGQVITVDGAAGTVTVEPGHADACSAAP